MKGLIITDLCPPDPGGRSEKIYRHVKHFTRHGINVHVLCPSTVKAEACHNIGTTGQTCHRVRPFLMNHLASLKWQEKFMAQSVVGEIWLRLNLPSGYLRWLLPAYLKACSLIRNESINFVIGVSNPVTIQLICILLKVSFRKLIYVAELRDPIVGYYRSRHSNIINSFIERIIVNAADCIVEWKDFTPTPFSEKYQKITHKCLYLNNVGYDPDDYTEFKDKEIYNASLDIVYTGGYYGEKTLWEIFFTAINCLVQKGLDINIHYYGDWDSEQEMICEKFDNEDLGWLNIYGRVSKKACVTACMKSNVTLYMLDANEENLNRVSSKIYDYFACKRPIIAIVPENSLVEKKIRAYDDRFILTIPVGISLNIKLLSREVIERIEDIYEKFRLGTLNDGINFDESLCSCVPEENTFVNTVSKLVKNKLNFRS